ncbi:hypothetical protein DM01DRAFT_1271435, partial [Hesseltinella vesiculosa]
SFDLYLGLQIHVINMNILKAQFDSLKATVYHPLAPHQAIGKGNIDHLTIGAYTTTQFVYPFQINYDPHLDTQGILQDIIDKCGFTGYPRQPITVMLELTPTIKFFNVAVSITVNHSIQLECPL